MNRRVLVVDDDPGICEVTRTCSQAVGGFTVGTATCGNAALRLLKHHELPDALLLDVMMPRLDGLSLVRKLRRRQRTQLHPWFLRRPRTSLPSSTFTGLGIRGAIGKPFNPMTLPTKFSALLGWDESSTP